MSRQIASVLAVILAVVCAAAAFVWLHAGGQSKTEVQFTPDPPASSSNSANEKATTAASANGSSAASGAAKPALNAAPATVFTPVSGEVLEFTGSVAKVSNVASLRLVVNGRKELAGKDAWHLQAFAHTQNPLRMVFELDDQFDSYSAPGDFASVQYEMRLNERGQKVQSVQRMAPTGLEPATAGASEARVLPGTRDPLGMMQYLRSVDWGKTPVVHGPVYDGHKLYEVRAQKIGSAEVEVPAGKFSTATVDIKVFDDGAEMKDAHFTVYLAKDAARTPVLLEAVLPFAAARVELTKKQ
ncbi:MAG TPA: DUF3108 domain-containing protein [Candidatus Acidoferrum sp.]|nr:DUF3108 domain-containing protein [Candidatus Acidoferrum sp.]